ncbi:MAG: polyprenol monophosphomannose synthase [Candidatus Paceibacterota bacterium]|jgi:dolichol-phosphate mannosyltransferase
MSNIILIPTYNECDNIIDIISRIREYEKDILIMIIDDNSPDGTAKVVEELMIRDSRVTLFEHGRKEGLGVAYVDALNRVKTMKGIDNIITMDADGSHDPKYIHEMLKEVNNFDLIIGSRYVKGGGVENWEWYRRMLSCLGNIYSQIILGMKIKDLTAGYVCFRKSILDNINFKRFYNSGYAYQIEFKYYCVKICGASCVEVPIIFRERRKGQSKISLSIIIGGIITPIRLRFTVFTQGRGSNILRNESKSM